ncbi:methyltransferase domain-containing protein [Profundibacter sp.]|uniref:methyltransferase domain-containing protein n=1 Tax=Profundibacter sp. TaxID=3101071 RepID=UPI003D0C62C2
MRPAIDLLAQVPDLPAGDVIDLGCGNGPVGPALALRFQGHSLIGVDNSPAMLLTAERTGAYDDLVNADAATWQPQSPPALIFTNALCHWLPDHAALFARLAGLLTENGMLAVQMPRQFAAPSHQVLRDVASLLFPDRFDYSTYKPPVVPPRAYAKMLAPLGDINLWETDYIQRLAAVDTGHPVRHFTQSTAMRPIAAKLDDKELARFVHAYDAALADHYPLEPDGSVLFPFKRLFFTLSV